MTGYLKKKMEPIYNKHEKEIHDLIKKQVDKHMSPCRVDGSWGVIYIEVGYLNGACYDVVKKLKEILGVKVHYGYMRDDELLTSVHVCRIFWRDL